MMLHSIVIGECPPRELRHTWVAHKEKVGCSLNGRAGRIGLATTSVAQHAHPGGRAPRCLLVLEQPTFSGDVPVRVTS
jgi:hypothetical protein